MQNSPPRVVAGRYELLEQLGKGGLGVTHKAFDRERNTLVALKLITTQSDEAFAQFRREARAPQRFTHANVLTVIDAGPFEGGAYLVSPFIDGGSLQDLLKRGPLSLQDALHIASDVGAGLDAIRRAGLVHRDLKPSNILLTDDRRAVISDLGLALPRGEPTVTMAGLVVGTPAYMSPEQVRGDRVDSLSDIFAFGVIVYEMLAGRQPFAYTNVLESLQNTLSAEPPSLRSFNPSISEAVSKVVLRAMAKSPQDRYPTAVEFVAALKAAIEAASASTAEGLSESDAPARAHTPGWLVIAGSDKGRRIPVNETVVIGRAPAADVRLDGTLISRRHARMTIKDGHYVIQDLGSQNGLLVNGVRVDEARLEHGDQVTLGDVVLVFKTYDDDVSGDGTQEIEPVPRPSSLPSSREDAPGWLLIASGSRAGEQIPVHDAMVIGRSPDADVRLDDPGLSRQHARVTISEGRCVIQDLGSQNGLWVNSYRVNEAPLEDGDHVTIGGVSLVFKSGALPADGSVASERRVREFAEIWESLRAASAADDDVRFTVAAQQLVSGPLRQAFGYRVDNAVPAYRGIVGHVVSNAMLWIRHSRFPILCIADQGRPRILADVVRQIELARVGAFFAIVIVIPATGGDDRVAQVRTDLGDSVYRYDFVVIGRSEVEELIRHGSPRRLIQVMLAQGIELSGLSPYVVRGPVPEAMFFGREREIKQIMQSPQAYAIVGGRRIGKTSMLMKLARLLGYDPGWGPVYINCEDKFETSDFLAGISDALDMPLVADARALGRAFKEKTARSGRKIVCLVDEVDELISRDPQLIATWRALSFEGSCRFVLSGSRTLNRVGRDPRSPLFNFCEWITLGMLDRRSVAEIVIRPLEQLGFHVFDPEGVVEHVMRATAGHPNVVQWLCDRLVKTTSGRRLTARHVETVTHSPEFHEHLLETTWGDATALERLITLAVMKPAFTQVELEQSLIMMGIDDTKAIADALSTLRMFAVLDVQSGEYRVVNPSFLTAAQEARDVSREVGALKREVAG